MAAKRFHVPPPWSPLPLSDPCCGQLHTLPGWQGAPSSQASVEALPETVTPYETGFSTHRCWQTRGEGECHDPTISEWVYNVWMALIHTLEVMRGIPAPAGYCILNWIRQIIASSGMINVEPVLQRIKPYLTRCYFFNLFWTFQLQISLLSMLT